jgi:predicted aminopeptidase
MSLLLFSWFGLSAQQERYAHQLALIDSIRQFIFDDLKLDAGKDFYTTWDKDTASDSMYIYLYVSRSDTVLIPDNLYKNYWAFGRDEKGAIAKSKNLQALGYETLVYRTAGQSNARLNRKLLSYPDEAIAFILFHEATHRWLKTQSPSIPYIFEEALCDAVANAACMRFAERTKLLPMKKVLQQQKIFERFYTLMKNARAEIEKTPAAGHAKIMQACHTKILKLAKHGNQFVKDRLLYPVNHAYFLRVEPYSLNYFMMYNLLGTNIDFKRAENIIQQLTTLKLIPIFKETDDDGPQEIALPKQPSMFDTGH